MLIDIRGCGSAYGGALEAALGGVDLMVGARRVRRRRRRQRLGQVDAGATARRPRDARPEQIGPSVCGHELTGARGPRARAPRGRACSSRTPRTSSWPSASRKTSPSASRTSAWPPQSHARRVDEMLARFGLADLRLREPHLLSGGQKQRTALAGVLAVPRRRARAGRAHGDARPGGSSRGARAVCALRADGMTVVFVTQEMDEV